MANLLTRERLADENHPGTRALAKAIAGAGTAIECPQSASQIEARTVRQDLNGGYFAPSPEERMASIALGLTLAAMSKPRPQHDNGDDGKPDPFDCAESGRAEVDNG